MQNTNVKKKIKLIIHKIQHTKALRPLALVKKFSYFDCHQFVVFKNQVSIEN